MTKEAIEYIKKYRELDEKLYQTAPSNSVAHNALTKCLRYWDMAIKALEQEPMREFTEEESKAYSKALDKIYKPTGFNVLDETCKDCISREETMNLMRSLTRWCVRSEDGKFNNVGLLYDDVMFGIERLPSVHPEKKTGHWIVREDNTSYVRQFPRRWVECSHCGWSFSYDRIEDAYCSKCGARMSEVSE